MIRIRLKEMLQEYGVSISELSAQTGINRASLTQIAENKSKMVRLDTLDRLKLFFQLEYASDLLIDDDTATIYCTPHQLSDNHILLNFSVNVQLIRDSDPVKGTFDVDLAFQKINDKHYLLFGTTKNHPESIETWIAITKIFNKIHPVILDRFYYGLEESFLGSPYIGMRANSEIGIFPSEFIHECFENNAFFHVSIPKLSMETSYHFVAENLFDDGSIQPEIETPSLNPMFDDFSISQAQISLTVLPIKK